MHGRSILYQRYAKNTQTGGVLTAPNDSGHNSCQTDDCGITLVQIQWHMNLEKQGARVLGEYADSKYFKFKLYTKSETNERIED